MDKPIIMLRRSQCICIGIGIKGSKGLERKGSKKKRERKRERERERERDSEHIVQVVNRIVQNCQWKCIHDHELNVDFCLVYISIGLYVKVV